MYSKVVKTRHPFNLAYSLPIEAHETHETHFGGGVC